MLVSGFRKLTGSFERLRRTITRFHKDESGSVIIFGLFMFLIMMMVGGMAVDFMRFENERTRLQGTLDRAILAAADLDQTQGPADVVVDYFDKAGMSDYLDGEPTVVQTLGYREVSAEASIDVNTFFLDLVGIHSLTAPAHGTAAEGAAEIEISLVLDLSGSMGSNNKIANLRTAARDFVDLIYDRENPEDVSISLVPYSMHVNAGLTLLNQYNVQRTQNYSNCVSFDAADFNTTALPTTQALTQVGHFQYWGTVGPQYPGTLQPECRTDNGSQVVPLGGNATALKNQINTFTADGNTSIEIGMKWGVALLDPGTRGVVTNLIANNTISADFAGRPYDYDEDNVLKAIVVMTDGINTTQYDLLPAYKSGLSPVWRDTSTGRDSVDEQEWGSKDSDSRYNELYYIPYYQTSNSNTNRFQNTRYGSNPRQLTYPELWATSSMYYNAYYNFYRANGSSSRYYDWYDDTLTTVSPSTKDQRLAAICTAAKAQGIVVYAIGFEVTNASAAIMANCASSPNHFFRVNGLQISEAFAAIARHVNELRLTR